MRADDDSLETRGGRETSELVISNREPRKVCEHTRNIKSYKLGLGIELGGKART